VRYLHQLSLDVCYMFTDTTNNCFDEKYLKASLITDVFNFLIS